MKKNGFSIIELLAVIFIIGLLASILTVNYQEIRGQLALNRAAHQLLQDLRKTQEMAMSASDFSGNDCLISRASLHFASLSHLALGESFEASCSAEIIGNTQIKFTAVVSGPIGHYSYSWSGYASGCADDHICQKEITDPNLFYDAQVAVTNNDGQIISTSCVFPLSNINIEPQPIGNAWNLNLTGKIADVYYYGVYIDIGSNLDSSNTSYKLYIDVDGPLADGGVVGYKAGDDCVMAVTNIAEQGVIIKEIRNLTLGRFNTSIGFAPPNPDVNITGLGIDPLTEAEYNSVEIVLALESDPTKQRIVSVNRAGLLEMK